MTISLRAGGTHTSASAAVGSVNPAVPAGGQPGDIAILFVQGKGSTAGVAPTITTPGGWTLIGTVTNNGTLVAGTDTGSNTIGIYYDVGAAAGAIGNITATGFNSLGAIIHVFATSLTNGGWDVAQSTTGSDTSLAANISITGAGGIAVASGDWVIGCGGAGGDVGTLSAQTVAGMSGATLGTAVVQTNFAVTTGTDCRTVIVTRPVSSGSSSAAPTMTWTNASSTTAHARIFRLREVAAADTTVARFALSDPSPVDDTLGDVTLRVRAQTDTGVGGLDTDLYSGGSLVQSFVDSTTTSWQTFTHIVTNAISDYTALEVRLTGNAVPGTQTRVSWLELEVPEGTGGTTWNIDGTLAGTGTLSATGATDKPVTATRAGTGTLTATAASTKPVTATLAGTGTLTATASSTKPVDATLAGTGTLTATATVVPAGKSIDGTLAGTGTLTATAASTKPVTAALAGTGTLTATGASDKAVQATLSGTGTLTATGATTKPVQATATATGTLTATDAVDKPVQAAATATGTLTTSATSTKPVDATLAGTGTLTATASVVTAGKNIDGSLTATGTLTTTASSTKPVTATLAGTGTLTATATVTAHGVQDAQAALVGVGTLTGSMSVVKSVTATLSAIGTLTAAANVSALTSPGQMYPRELIGATARAGTVTGAGMAPRAAIGPQMDRKDSTGSTMKGG